MEHRDEESQERGGRTSRDAWRARSDRELIVAMRADISAAFQEFVARYEPLLQARSRRFQLVPWERDDCIAEVLESMMLRFVRPDVRAPKEMAAYLTRVLHNRLIDITRTRTVRVAEERHGVDWNSPSLEGAVTSLVSQHAIESCAVLQDAHTARLPAAVQRLADALISPLADDERLLIVWESNMIPHRTIAGWLGLSHAAVTKRIWRLRCRLRESAEHYAETLERGERAEIDRITRYDGSPAVRQAPRAAAEHRHCPVGIGASMSRPETEEHPDE